MPYYKTVLRLDHWTRQPCFGKTSNMEKLSEDPPVSITVKMQPELRDRLEAWRAEQLAKSSKYPNMSETVRELLTKALDAEAAHKAKKK